MSFCASHLPSNVTLSNGERAEQGQRTGGYVNFQSALIFPIVGPVLVIGVIRGPLHGIRGCAAVERLPAMNVFSNQAVTAPATVRQL